MRWDKLEWAEKSWDELRRSEKSWDEVRWGEKSWDEVRWDEVRWGAKSWDEVRWVRGAEKREKMRTHEMMRWAEKSWKAEKGWEELRRGDGGRWDEMRWEDWDGYEEARGDQMSRWDDRSRRCQMTECRKVIFLFLQRTRGFGHLLGTSCLRAMRILKLARLACPGTTCSYVSLDCWGHWTAHKSAQDVLSFSAAIASCQKRWKVPRGRRGNAQGKGVLGWSLEFGLGLNMDLGYVLADASVLTSFGASRCRLPLVGCYVRNDECRTVIV